MKYINIDKVVSFYIDNKKQRYLCIHIENKEQHDKLKDLLYEMNPYSESYKYYLTTGGYSERRGSYESPEYYIIEFEQINFGESYEIY